MGVLRYNFRSESLSLSTDITITYPSERFSYYGIGEEKREEGPFDRRPLVYQKGMKFQTIYLLHGGSDDDTSIIRRTNLERYAEENCVMTVTAQVKDSFFMDTQYGYSYFTYMTQELPKIVQSLFSSSNRREDNFVLGVAMGGNGALALAMKRPDLYAACVDLSGGVGCSIDTDYFIEELKTFDMQRLRSTFGSPDNVRNSSYDLGYYAKKNMDENIAVPKIFIGVGENDFIRDVVRKDRDALNKLGYHISYEEAPGLGHDWNFWDLYIKKAIYEWLPLKKMPLLE